MEKSDLFMDVLLGTLKRKHISASTVAQQLGVSLTTWTRIKNNPSGLTLRQADILATLVDVPLERLLTIKL